MFDNLIPLMGHSGAVLVLLSGLGVVATVALSEVLGSAFRARRRPRAT